MVDRFICTKESPWTEDKGRAIHPDAINDGSSGDFFTGSEYDNYTCPNCGKSFSCEVAQ